MRKYIVPQSSTLTYLAGDHLGSTSLAVDASTGDVTQTRYKPWGEVRYTTPSKTLPTRYTFTGQYSYVSDDATDLGNAGFGLMFYNARWYDPTIGRFAQADSIVPGGIQGLDRFAYVGNSPVNYVDPSGHKPCWATAKYTCNLTQEQIAELLGGSRSEHDFASNYLKELLGGGHPRNPTYVVLFCGVDDGTDCGTSGPLAPYYQWAKDNGFHVIIYDVDTCGPKSACFKDFTDRVLDKHPNTSFYFIGHSAGADVAILAADYMINSGRTNHLLGVILLDPTLTWTNNNGVKVGLQSEFSNIVGKTKLYVGVTSSSFEKYTLLGNRSPYDILKGYVGTSGYTLERWDDSALVKRNPSAGGNFHKAISMDQTVCMASTYGFAAVPC